MDYVEEDTATDKGFFLVQVRRTPPLCVAQLLPSTDVCASEPEAASIYACIANMRLDKDTSADDYSMQYSGRVQLYHRDCRISAKTHMYCTEK